VRADEGLIERVLQNLIGNAIKFTPPGGAIGVLAEAPSAEPGWVRISIRDTGPGVPDELRGRLFQKFAAGQQAGRGSGLGLAFCRLVVEAHGGRIWAEGEPGQGAIFIFTLPQASQARPARSIAPA
jgi:signal transduction histidine kinase